MNSRIGKRVVIIGGGGHASFFGRQHRNAGGLLWGQEVVGLLGSRDPEKSLAQAQEWGVGGFRSIDEVLAAKSNFDYAIVATPNNQHADPAIACIEAGIPVYLEKPAAHYLGAAAGIMQASLKSQVPVGMSNTWQYGFGATLAYLVSRDPRMGKAISGRCHYLQGWAGLTPGSRGFRGKPEENGYWGSGGDLGLTHGLQAVMDTAGGKRINRVIAVGNTFGIAEENERDAHFILFLENGALVSLQSSQVYGEGRGNDMEVEMAFDLGGRVQWSNTDLDHAMVTIPGYGREMLVARGSGDWTNVPIINDAVIRARSLFPHTSGHEKQWEGHVGEELPPYHHEWGCPTAIATGHFRFGNWIDKWRYGGQKEIPSDSCGTVPLNDGLHHMDVMEAARLSDHNCHALTVVLNSFAAP